MAIFLDGANGIYLYFVSKHLSSWLLLGLNKIFNSLPNNKIWTGPNSQRMQTYCNSKFEFYVREGRKHSGKRRKCWLPECFQKADNSRVVKSWDYVVNS